MRTLNKVYEATAVTESSQAARALKTALTQRVESDRNKFYADKITARNDGTVQARIGYALPRGTSTPTHIRELVDAVAYKADIELVSEIAVVRVAV